MIFFEARDFCARAFSVRVHIKCSITPDSSSRRLNVRVVLVKASAAGAGWLRPKQFIKSHPVYRVARLSRYRYKKKTLSAAWILLRTGNEFTYPNLRRSRSDRGARIKVDCRSRYTTLYGLTSGLCASPSEISRHSFPSGSDKMCAASYPSTATAVTLSNYTLRGG